MADLMSPKQNFSWHRATPLVAVIAFIGFVVVRSSLAANSVAFEPESATLADGALPNFNAPLPDCPDTLVTAGRYSTLSRVRLGSRPRSFSNRSWRTSARTLEREKARACLANRVPRSPVGTADQSPSHRFGSRA